MKHFLNLLADNWLPAFILVVASIGVGGLLLFRLPSQPAQFSQAGFNARQHASSIQSLLDKPLYIPHASGQFILQKLGRKGVGAMRIVSVLFALLVIICFFLLIEVWHTRRIAVLSTILLASSSWFLHLARNVTPEIMFTLLPVLLVTAMWLQSRQSGWLALLAITIIVAGILYVPGFIWLVIAAILWQNKQIRAELKQTPPHIVTVCLIVFIVLLAPLVYGMIRDPGFIRQLAGIPATLPAADTFGRNVLAIPKQLFWHGPDDSNLWLPGTPLLDIFTMGALLFGVYAYSFRFGLDRTRLLLAYSVVCCVLISLDNAVSIAILLPAVYIIAAAGVALLLQQWFTVFPRNPFARSIGIIFVCAAVAASSLYNINHYFVAWQHAPETKQTFNIAP